MGNAMLKTIAIVLFSALTTLSDLHGQDRLKDLEEEYFRWEAEHNMPPPEYPAGAQVDAHEGDSLALVALYNATGGSSTWLDFSGWLVSPVSQWHGILLDSRGRVNRIDLRSNGLSGELPVELGQFTELDLLLLSQNNLTGTIPSELQNLKKARWLVLSRNKLTGEIPPELGNMSGLELLSLSSNRLSDSIPPEIGNLSKLTGIWMLENNLSGSIPPELGRLTELASFNLMSNNLSGSIPEELGQLDSLHSLELRNNDLSGSIPPALGQLSKLSWLQLGANNLSGGIPRELGNLGELRALYLYDNNLSGALPKELGQLPELNTLFVAGNQLSGSIPSELGDLDGLAELDLNNNQLSGPVPDLTALSQLDLVRVQNNQFLFVDLLPNASLNRLDEFIYAPQSLIETQLTCDAPHYVFTTPAIAEGNRYQWYRNGTAMPNEQSDTLRVSATESTARYHAIITNNSLPALALQSRMKNTFGAAPCQASQFAHEGDSLVLVEFFNSTKGNSWTISTGWLQQPVSEWHGITLDGTGRVTEIVLQGNDLEGRLPQSLGQLANLETLDLGEDRSSFPNPQNAISGIIPPELGQLSKLRRLRLSSNRLEGGIPVQLTQLANLRSLDLFDNNLTGEIPLELGQLTELTYLSLGFSDLTGHIPYELGQLTELDTLNISFTDLSGPIPPELGNLTKLVDLSLCCNKLSGSIPPELGQLSLLRHLALPYNDLSGPIPPEMEQLRSMRWLDLKANHLSGRIPPNFAQLSHLQVLLLDENQLSGSVPDWTGLEDLRALYLNDNQFLFADLLPNAALSRPHSFEYAPQDTIETQLTCSASGFALTTPAKADGNRYQWYRNDESIPGAQSDTLRLAAGSDPDHYHATISNDALPDLTLISHKVSTGGADPCTTQQYANVADSTLLVDFYNRTHGSLLWHNHTGWLEEPVAEWYGITLDASGRVTRVNLSRNNLVGQLPLSQLHQLPHLRHLDVSGNEFSGTIPKGLGALTQLEYLDLSHNTLAGEIPKELAGQAPLKMLDVGDNQLVGAIPTELSQITTLQKLSLFYNQLSGPMPAFTGLDQLDSLDVSWNAFLFMDLLPNASLTRLDDFVYAPQDSIETLLSRTASGFALTTAAKAVGNRYQWYRDDLLISGPQSDTLHVSATSDPAQYHVAITNDRLPDLTLVSRKKGVHDGLTLTEADIPDDFLLHQSYPNPFAEATTVAFELGTPEHVRIVVYDLLGKVVATIADGRFTAGMHRVEFTGDHLASGQYMYRMEAGAYRATRFMSVVR